MSLSASELRIGNIINYRNFNDIELHWKDLREFDIKPKDVLSRIYQPIPLTEEWLLNFGFEHVKDSKAIGNVFKIDLLKNYSYLKICNKGNKHCVVGVFYLKTSNNSFALTEAVIKYVHQLQNLYFALTGEELKIK